MAQTMSVNTSTLIEIEMLPAGHGDSLLVSASTRDNKKINLLIDCGFAYTYRDVIREKLLELTKRGEHLSRLIITHIDADHINGALPFLRENGSSENSKIIKIDQIWHNTFRHMQFEKEEAKINFGEKEILNSIIVRGYPDIEDGISRETEIGAKEGITLGALIFENNYSWNEDSSGEAICSDTKFKNDIHKDIGIKILSPSKDKLDALKSKFIDAIEDMGIGDIKDDKLFNDAFEYLTSRLKSIESKEKEISMDEMNISDLSNEKYFKEDTEAPNGSSIAFILEVADKKLLFLGDAHSSQIEMELEKIYPKENHTYPIFFDAVKLSHHGSSGNTSPKLLKIIDSDKFLISTNGGRYRHPDKETIARIVNRPTKATRNLYFNYETVTSDAFDNSTLKIDYDYEIIYPKNRIKI